jgi:hypothetical protein
MTAVINSKGKICGDPKIRAGTASVRVRAGVGLTGTISLIDS